MALRTHHRQNHVDHSDNNNDQRREFDTREGHTKFNEPYAKNNNTEDNNDDALNYDTYSYKLSHLGCLLPHHGQQ